MPDSKTFPLDAVRTDGWFERIAESVGSFQALCDIVGERFFAYSMITGARITALTVDRRNPENTLVDFVVGGGEDEALAEDAQRLTLAEFRRRLVSALVQEDAGGPPPRRETDTEAIQLHIGVRYLLLAPLYGYGLEALVVGDEGSVLRLLHDGAPEEYPLETFRELVRAHVRHELSRASGGQGRGAIDLSRVAEAEEASRQGEPARVVELLGAWPGPLAIFLRTPEGQMVAPETRATIAKGLGLLGSACVELDEVHQAEEILRLAVQYAGDAPIAAEIYRRLGEALLSGGRPGEAIGPLRRAANLGSVGEDVWLPLALAFEAQGRHLAALGALMEAAAAGVPSSALDAARQASEKSLGASLLAWHDLVGSGAS
jgi:hypothetical protein